MAGLPGTGSLWWSWKQPLAEITPDWRGALSQGGAESWRLEVLLQAEMAGLGDAFIEGV